MMETNPSSTRSGSVNFDRAASFYDETRRHRPEVSAALRDIVLKVLRDQAAQLMLPPPG